MLPEVTLIAQQRLATPLGAATLGAHVLAIPVDLLGTRIIPRGNMTFFVIHESNQHIMIMRMHSLGVTYGNNAR